MYHYLKWRERKRERREREREREVAKEREREGKRRLRDGPQCHAGRHLDVFLHKYEIYSYYRLVQFTESAKNAAGGCMYGY